jgi:miniconductance mechanosensitive channel
MALSELINVTTQLLREWQVAESLARGAAQGVGLLALVALAWLGNFVAKRVILRTVSALVRRTPFDWDDILLECGVFTRLSHLAPALVINYFGDDVLGGTEEVGALVTLGVNLYLIVIWLMVLFGLLDSVQRLVERRTQQTGTPVKGFVQAIKLIATVIAVVFTLAMLLGKSPVIIFSGLGAATAVLMLIFRDAILGFVAGIMISVNDIVRVGDWIEMPSAGADGDVIDVSLTTVKVQNWDRTITSIPTYNLIAESFKNWRGMQEAGGRRIKRAIHLDLGSIRFADEEMLERWSKLGHVREHLEQKRREIAADNEKLGAAASVLGNGRRLTNIGTFRAYCVSYLRKHPHIAQNLTFIVRQLEPTEHGLPLEIYVFVNNTQWVFYEGVQADIFDHLLSVVPVFGLRVYQAPSGHDVSRAAEALTAARREA